MTRDWETRDSVLDRHCGLDQQSPKRKGDIFAFGRWRMFLRYDGKRNKAVLSLSRSLEVKKRRLILNINK